MIRLAKRENIPEMLAIYAPYVLHTAISFEYTVPSVAEFTRRFDEITADFPWLVWEEDGRILGYAYAHRAFTRPAYRWGAELTIYLDRDARGRGIGTALYHALEQLLTALGYHNLYGLVTQENEASCRFHEHMGYTLYGTLPDMGYKFGRFYGLCWYDKTLCTDTPTKMPVPFSGEFPGL